MPCKSRQTNHTRTFNSSFYLSGPEPVGGESGLAGAGLAAGGGGAGFGAFGLATALAITTDIG